MSEEQHELEIASADAAERLSAASPVQLIDVREQHEREAGYIPGSSHIPLGDLPARVGELDQQTPVIVYCRVGARSLMAAQALSGAGFQAYSLAGGILDWAASGHELEPSGAVVAEMEQDAA